MENASSIIEAIRNCTPHAISFYKEADCVLNTKTRSYDLVDADVEPWLVLQPEEAPIPRCTTIEEADGALGGIPMLKLTFGEVENLPPQQDGVLLIVSAICAAAGREQGRTDLVTPAHMVRDQDGKILGCTSLASE